MKRKKYEEPPHSCPDIDAVKTAIENVMSEANTTECEYCNSAYDNLNGTDQTLESIRDINSDLRDWGTENQERAEQLESELEDVKTERDNYGEKISELEEHIQSLERTIESKDAEITAYIQRISELEREQRRLAA